MGSHYKVKYTVFSAWKYHHFSA